jgi:hypothetical protein
LARLDALVADQTVRAALVTKLREGADRFLHLQRVLDFVCGTMN